MKASKNVVMILVVLFLTSTVSPLQPVDAVPTSERHQTDTSTLPVENREQLSKPVLYYADKENVDFHQPAAVRVQQRVNAFFSSTSSIIVQPVAAGAKNMYGDTCEAFPPEALAAFQYAADQWGLLLNASVPITIQACWWNYNNSSILGYGGYYVQTPNFTGAPLPNTEYSQALANTLAGNDLNGTKPEIGIAINKNFPYYYFVDMPPPGYYSLATVAMHEIGHGLGFSGSMEVFEDNGTLYGGWGSYPSYQYPIVYDVYGLDYKYDSLLSYTNESTALRDALLQQMYFNGPAAKASYGNQPVPLFSPNPWMPGSSYSHLAEIFNTYNGGINRLMTYSLGPQETNYHPGPVGMGVMQDLGWNIPAIQFFLSDNTIPENQVGVIGNFSDSDPTKTFTYTLLPDLEDNNKFVIEGNELSIVSAPDYEVKSSYSVVLEASDGVNDPYILSAEIEVLDVDEPPTQIFSDEEYLIAGTPIGYAVATFYTDNPEINDPITYTIIGGVDEDKFSIFKNLLVNEVPLSLDWDTTYEIIVQAEDQGAGTINQTFIYYVYYPYSLFLPAVNR